MQNGGRWRSGNKQGEEREEIAWMAQFSERQDRKSSHSAAAAVLSVSVVDAPPPSSRPFPRPARLASLLSCPPPLRLPSH